MSCKKYSICLGCAFVVMALLFVLPSVAMSAEAVASGLVSVGAGPLELTPIRATMVLAESHGQSPVVTYILANINFKMVNVSESKIEVILFTHSVKATDYLGEDLLDHPNFTRVSGVGMSRKYPNEFNRSFTEEKRIFTTLYPLQPVNVQVSSPESLVVVPRVVDPNQHFQKTHRPSTVSFTATLGIIYPLDNRTELQTFSFDNVPVRVSTR